MEEGGYRERWEKLVGETDRVRHVKRMRGTQSEKEKDERKRYNEYNNLSKEEGPK